ncbi:MAG: electron transfer flavoprotein subunit alpha [Pseudomonadota bacterium]
MTIWIIEERCDGCKRCQRACVYDAIDIISGVARVTERCTSCGACVGVCKNEAIGSDITPREVPDFSDYSGVWVVVEQRDGHLADVGLELLGKARNLAQDLGQGVAAVLLGKDVAHLCDTLADYGAGTIYLVDHDLLRQYRTIAYADAIQALVNQYKPSILLMGATPLGRDLAPRVSRRLGSGLTADCTELTIDPDEKILLQTRPAFGGNVMATIANRYSRPQMATVRSGVMEKRSIPGQSATIIRADLTLDESRIRTRILDTVTEKPTGKDITQANVIVAGGRGVNGKPGFDTLRKLADILGGEVACSRLVVEQQILSQGCQVGQTGKTVRPEIYIACGISGAIQHRAGMMGSRYIIAINTDPEAPIFTMANWGIVGDVNDIVPELIRQLQGGTLQ